MRPGRWRSSRPPRSTPLHLVNPPHPDRPTLATTRCNAGFTLVELLLVVTLIGLFAAMAMPRLDTSSFRTDAAVQAVGTTLLAAQRSAVARQHTVVVAFDGPGRRLRIHDDSNNNGVVDEGERVRFEPLGEGITFTGPVDVLLRIGTGPVSFTRTQDGMPAVFFHRNGSASEEGGLYLTTDVAQADDSRVHARAILIERATGRVSWFRSTATGWERGF